MTTTTLSVTEARNNLLNLIRESKAMLKRIVITKNGKPEAVLMSYDEFESWMETLEIAQDPKLVEEILQSKKEAEEGRVIPLKQALASSPKRKMHGKHK